MGGLLQSTPWRAKPKTAAQSERRNIPEGASAKADRREAASAEELRGVAISDSVCGLFVEIKARGPNA